MTAIQVRALLPSVFCYGQYDLYKRWLACMRITLVPLIAMIFATFVHVLLCLLFVHGLGMDIIGLAIASSIKDAVLLSTVMVYGCCSSKISIALVPINKDAFSGWSEYLKISLPSTIMICSEWWAFEFITVLAGVLGVVELASITVVNGIVCSLFMVPLGIQEATCGIIGNCIGSNNVPLAKRFFGIITKFTIIVVLVLCLTTYLARS